MSKNLVIVESPAKAKTIEKILGKEFTVKSSMGHVRDLMKGNKAVDIDNNFSPSYEVTPDKKRIVKELKDWVKKVDEVWLATDEDREGEAISWHLCQVLGLDEKQTKRIVFREITAPAITQAIKNPRHLDIGLVNAQQARRILDRLVGFELSELLWKKIKGKLSAGRVQSVAVKLIVEREREIQQFEPQAYFKIAALFKVIGEDGSAAILKAELPDRINDEGTAKEFLEKCATAVFTIEDIAVRPLKRRPAAPFTTSTLQQEASRKLGFSVSRTMINAQRLYEQGYITYMRTDSTNLSEVALVKIAEEIESSYGSQYVKVRRYKGKKANAQEAHEAIRPSYIERQFVTNDRDQQRLYELIWKRTIASQMADAELEKTTVKIGVSTIPDSPLQAVGEVLKFDGFLKVYLESKDDDEEEETSGILPPLHVGQLLTLQEMTGTERFTRPPARYTEAMLVKKLEELGIGRPSTYAPTISKIMEDGRGYVEKGDREGVERKFSVLRLEKGKITRKDDVEITGAIKNRLVPTDMGMIVSDFLSEYFKEIMDYGFTAQIEGEFDHIAEGDTDWQSMLKSFYFPFHKTVENTLKTADRASGERILGEDPATGRTVLIRMSRLGKPVVQIGTGDELQEDEKPRYANLRPGQTMEQITFEDALELFKLPKNLGDFEGHEVVVAVGRYGPYVRHGESFISLDKGEDPMEVNMARAKELILQKREADAPVATFKGLPVSKGKGRFGPFLKWNDLFINIPKKYHPEKLTKEEVFSLIEAKLEKEANRFIQKWDEENIAIENGRWGPFIRFGKKSIKIPKKDDGQRVSAEEAQDMSLEEVKKLIEAEIPNAFAKKKKATTRKKKS